VAKLNPSKEIFEEPVVGIARGFRLLIDGALACSMRSEGATIS